MDFVKFLAFHIILLGILETTQVDGKNQYDNTGNEKAYFELDAWETPSDLMEDFPYYISGYDLEGRPVWIAPLGKWNYPKLIAKGEKKLQEFEKTAEQFRYRLYNSPKYAPKLPDNSTVDTWVLLSDMDGYDLTQLTNLKAMQLALKVMSKFEILCQNMEYAFIVNSNFFSERFLNLMKPFLGNTFARLSVYGTRRDKWQADLLKHIPRTSLPTSLGGTKNCTSVFGRYCEG